MGKGDFQAVSYLTSHTLSSHKTVSNMRYIDKFSGLISEEFMSDLHKVVMHLSDVYQH